MSRIRGTNTKPELAVRKALWARRLRYRVHYGISGRPDIVFPVARVAIFIDGCFWHGCLTHGVRPRTNAAFWSQKIERNKSRDLAITRLLTSEGWSVIRFWEHEVEDNVDEVVARITKEVEGSMGTGDRKANRRQRRPQRSQRSIA
jgi:DNA mismatch endonuclease, patch repair protein